jgi:hypothetical protein
MKLIAFASVLMLAAVGCESAIVGATCQAGFTKCGAACVNTQRDFTNCGKCGNVCSDILCLDGKCEARAEAGAGATAKVVADAATSE